MSEYLFLVFGSRTTTVRDVKDPQLTFCKFFLSAFNHFQAESTYTFLRVLDH